MLGSVGVDSVDVKAATARGIPVTNCPDTFIEEVADHAMMLLLSSFRRTIEQDRMVREGKWREGRPALLKIPRLMGQTLGLVSFGHVARAVAKRAKPFGLRIIAYDPFIEELVMVEHGVIPAHAGGSAVAVRLRLHACTGTAGGRRHARREALPADEEDRDLHQHRPWRRRCRKLR